MSKQVERAGDHRSNSACVALMYEQGRRKKTETEGLRPQNQSLSFKNQGGNTLSFKKRGGQNLEIDLPNHEFEDEMDEIH